jgi:hypothetical protein
VPTTRFAPKGLAARSAAWGLAGLAGLAILVGSAVWIEPWARSILPFPGRPETAAVVREFKAWMGDDDSVAELEVDEVRSEFEATRFSAVVTLAPGTSADDAWQVVERAAAFEEFDKMVDLMVVLRRESFSGRINLGSGDPGARDHAALDYLYDAADSGSVTGLTIEYVSASGEDWASLSATAPGDADDQFDLIEAVPAALGIDEFSLSDGADAFYLTVRASGANSEPQVRALYDSIAAASVVTSATISPHGLTVLTEGPGPAAGRRFATGATKVSIEASGPLEAWSATPAAAAIVPLLLTGVTSAIEVTDTLLEVTVPETSDLLAVDATLPAEDLAGVDIAYFSPLRPAGDDGPRRSFALMDVIPGETIEPYRTLIAELDHGALEQADLDHLTFTRDTALVSGAMLTLSNDETVALARLLKGAITEGTSVSIEGDVSFAFTAEGPLEVKGTPPDGAAPAEGTDDALFATIFVEAWNADVPSWG